MITLRKIIPVCLLFSGLILITAQSKAACTLKSSDSVFLGSIPSFTMTEIGVQSVEFDSGLSCTAVTTAGRTVYRKYRIEDVPVNFINKSNDDTIRVRFTDHQGKALTSGAENESNYFILVNINDSSDMSMKFKATVEPGQSVSPGYYTLERPFKIKWYYSVPYGASSDSSPGFSRGGLFGGGSWGSGSDVVLDMSLIIASDCRISSKDVNFGTAVFASEFKPVKSSIGIRCSAKTPYYVGLNNGLYPQNGNQRAMKSETSNNYMSYEIYKNSTTERWGTSINERWLSSNATTNAGNYDGLNSQGYSFTTKILETNSDNLPPGNYSDTVTISVIF